MSETRQDIIRRKADEIRMHLGRWAVEMARQLGLHGEEIVFSLRIRPRNFVYRDERDTLEYASDALPIEGKMRPHTGVTFVRPAVLDEAEIKSIVDLFQRGTRDFMVELLVDNRNNPLEGRYRNVRQTQINKALSSMRREGLPKLRLGQVGEVYQLWEVRAATIKQ